MILIGQFAFAIYARVVWECCGVPVSKLNKDEYLLSRYIGTSGDLIVAFNLLKIEGQEQIKWLQEWADNDKDGDDRMDIDEFHKYFQLKELRNEVISSRTRSDDIKKCRVRAGRPTYLCAAPNSLPPPYAARPPPVLQLVWCGARQSR